MEFLDIGASHVVRIDQLLLLNPEVEMSQWRVQLGGTSRGTEKVHS